MRTVFNFALFIAIMTFFSAANSLAAEKHDVAKVVGQLDEQLHAAWQRAVITAAPRVDDTAYLRRAALDLTGRLPTPDEIAQFTIDKSADKRAQLIERLLQSEAYATHWTNYWDAILIGRLTREAYIDRAAFRTWLNEQFVQNVPWDQLVRELLTAEGYNTNRRPGKATSDPKNFKEEFAPATNWFLRYSRSIPELAGATAKIFLGVQIQCAQCHDHKTEKWKQQDFKQFTAFFTKTWPTYYDRTFIVGTVRLDTRDRWTVPPQAEKFEMVFGSYKDYIHDRPKALEGPEASLWRNRREQLADWMTQGDNPWFAPAIVNRLWGQLLGKGFVEPIDDFRPNNPATLDESLRLLADDFVDHGYDLQRLLKVICTSDAYQRSCVAAEVAKSGHDLWSRYPLKPVEVETLLEMLIQATDSESTLDRLTKQRLDLVRSAFVRQFVMQMGTDDMAEVNQNEVTIPRALLMLNSTLVNSTTRDTTGLGLQRVLSEEKDDAACIDRLYLLTVSRRPTESERKHWLTFVKTRQHVASTPGPKSEIKVGPAALVASTAISNAADDADFAELVKQAQTAADFSALFKRMKNNADAGILIKAFEAWAAEVPFATLALAKGEASPRSQAFEDLYWALINSTEFLTNH